jgi:WD40 repeat protein
VAEGKPSGIAATVVGVPTDGTEPAPISGVDATVSQPPETLIEQQLTEVARTHYEIRDELARGGMGRILIAHDRRIGRTVAVKELLGNADAARFEREALVTGRLQHPAIVPVYEAGRWPSGEPFFAMKLVKGTSLDKVIATKTNLGERLALLPTIIQIAEALAYAHSEHVIHRDLKPQNVLVGAYGETVVVDWGLAKDLGDPTARDSIPIGPYRSPATSGDLTMAGSVMGTPMYMPVEQARGMPLDERCDVYALGAILYHVLAGRPPYAGKTADHILDQVNEGPPKPLTAVADGIPDELAAIVDKAMARELGQRYRTATQLAEELVRFQAGQLVAAHRYSRWDLIKRFAKRHRAALSAAAALLVIGGVIAVVSVRQVVAARDEAREALATVEREQRAFLIEEGRQELVAARTTKAATLLGGAYATGAADGYLQTLLGEAMRPVDAARARVEAGLVHDVLPLAFDRFVALVDAEVSVWSLDGKPLRTIATPEPGEIAVSHDGKLLAIPSTTAVEVLDVRDLRPVLTLESDALNLAFSPDHKRLYGVEDATAELVAWTLDGKEVGRIGLDEPADNIHSLSILANGVVFVQTHDPGVLLVSADLTKVVKRAGDTVRPSGDGSHVGIGIAKEDGGLMLSIEVYAATDLTKPVIEISAGTIEFVLDHTGHRVLQLPGAEDAVLHSQRGLPLARMGAKRATLAPDGRHLATTDEHHVIRVWNGPDVIAVLPGHQREIHALSFSADSKTLISGGEDGARVWHVPSPAMHRLPAAMISDRGGSPDGRHLVATRQSEAVIFDVASRAEVGVLATGAPPWVASYSPDGRRIVTTTRAGTLQVWDAASRSRLAAADVFAWSARFSPDSARLVTAGDVDGHIYDAATGNEVVTLTGSDLVMSARYSADGARVITAAQDGVARVYNAASGTLVLALRGHADYLVDASFDQAGARIVTASGDRTARLWDARTGIAIATLPHAGAVTAAELSPDGTRVLTIAFDGGRVWDTRTGRQLALLGAVDSDPVIGGRFLHDDLLVTYTKKTAMVWEASRGAPMLTLPPRPPVLRAKVFEMGTPAFAGRGDDPRLRVANLIELSSSRLALAGPDGLALLELPRETRSAPEISAVLAQRGDWQIVDGGLVPTHEVVERKRELRVTTLDFSDDQIEGDTARPAYVAAPGPSDAIEQAIAALAADRTKVADARAAIAGLPDAPSLPRDSLYRLAWLRHQLGDHLPAFRALRAAAMQPGWTADARMTIVRELAVLGAYADVSFDDTLAAISSSVVGRELDRATVLDKLVEVYSGTGDLALEARALAALAPLAAPARAVAIRARQARHAFDAGRTREFRKLGLAALAELSKPVPQDRDSRREIDGKVRDEIVDQLITLAKTATTYAVVTQDESYARAALAILEAARAPAPGRKAEIDPLVAALQAQIANGPRAAGSYNKDLVRSALRGRYSRIRRCYERGLAIQPALAGKITFTLRLVGGEIAKVGIKSTTLADPKVGACVVDELRTMPLPRAVNAGVVEISYPLVFRGT